MIKVKSLEVFRVPDGRKSSIGAVYEVSERYAMRLVAAGAAELVEKAPAKKKAAKKKAAKKAAAKK